jgi:hypothetical protein
MERGYRGPKALSISPTLTGRCVIAAIMLRRWLPACACDNNVEAFRFCSLGECHHPVRRAVRRNDLRLDAEFTYTFSAHFMVGQSDWLPMTIGDAPEVCWPRHNQLSFK